MTTSGQSTVISKIQKIKKKKEKGIQIINAVCLDHYFHSIQTRTVYYLTLQTRKSKSVCQNKFFILKVFERKSNRMSPTHPDQTVNDLFFLSRTDLNELAV